MNPAYLPALANHLWQSTLFAGVAGLLTLALRQNHARVRVWVWLAASCKFLIPLSVLIVLGSQIGWRTRGETAPSNLSFVMDEVSQPFTAPTISLPSAVAAPSGGSRLPAVLLSIWVFGFIGITCTWWVRWRRIRTAVRLGSPLHLELPIRAVSSPIMEPGVFGVFRPVLLLPEGILDRLTAAQLKGVVAHELCHVYRRDNLIAAIHMYVETVFWFHPLVWWMGARLLEERERACDEAVLNLGTDPRVYAEGILKICKLYVESPLPCVSGVTGSNLKKRIEQIMTKRTAQPLNRTKRLLVATAGIATLAGPVLIGVGNAPAMRAQSPARTVTGKPLAFDAASVKPYRGATGDDAIPVRGVQFTRGGVTGQNVTAREIILAAFRVTTPQLSGGPSWLDSDTFALEGKTESPTNNDRLCEMLQTVLAERFKLAVHRATKETPVYFLTVGKNGPKLKEWKDGEPKPDMPRRTATATGGMWNDRGSIEHFADHLSSSPQVGRPVLDRTGLPGIYLLDVEWEVGDDLMHAVEDKFGLKFESQKAPVDVIVIDHIEKPNAN